MNPDFDLYGVYIPSLIVLAAVSLVITSLVTRFLRRTGFYRYAWHPALFNASLYVIILALSVMVLHRTL